MSLDGKVDWEQLRDGFEASIRGQLEQLLEGGAAAIDGPIRDASNRLAVAARRGRKDLAAEAADQIALAIREQGLRARAAAPMGALDAFLTGGVNMLLDGALAGLGSILKRK